MKWSAFALLLLFIPGSAWMLSAENTPPTQEPSAKPSPPLPVPCACGEKTATQTELAKDQEKTPGEAKRVDFPCFCPEFEFEGGTIGTLHDEDCSHSEPHYLPAYYETQFCDSNMGGAYDCDCMAVKIFHQLPGEGPEKQPAAEKFNPKPALAKKYGGDVSYERDLVRPHPTLVRLETCIRYLELVDEEVNEVKVYAKAFQVVQYDRNKQKQAVMNWGGVEIENLPRGERAYQLRRVGPDERLGKNKYKVTYVDNPRDDRDVEVIHARVSIRNEPDFYVAILMTRPVKATKGSEAPPE